MFKKSPEESLAPIIYLDDFRKPNVEQVLESLIPLDEFATETALAERSEQQQRAHMAHRARFAASLSVLNTVAPRTFPHRKH